MTTVKVKFRPSTVEGRPGTIVYFVTHRRIVRQITTGYKVFPHEWDDKQSSLVVTSAGGANGQPLFRLLHKGYAGI